MPGRRSNWIALGGAVERPNFAASLWRIALAALGMGLIVWWARGLSLAVTVPPKAFWQLPLFAVVMALVAGAIGMRKVLKADPSQAFAGAGV